MCDCLIWHPVWRAAARRARVRPALVLAVRAALAEDQGLAGRSHDALSAILAEGLAASEDTVGRVLEALEGLGVLVQGRVVVPAALEVRELGEAMLKPSTRRMRALRERRRALLSTGVTGDASVTPVTGKASHLAQDRAEAAWSTAYKPSRFQQLGVPGESDAEASQVTPYVYVTKEHKQKGSARREEPLSGARATPEAPAIVDPTQLDERGLVRWRWVQAVKRFAEREMRAERLSREQCNALYDALPDALVLKYAARRCNLPVEAYQALSELDARRKGKPPAVKNDGQRSLMLPIEGGTAKPAIGSPGSGTLAAVDGDLPEVLTA